MADRLPQTRQFSAPHFASPALESALRTRKKIIGERSLKRGIWQEPGRVKLLQRMEEIDHRVVQTTDPAAHGAIDDKSALCLSLKKRGRPGGLHHRRSGRLAAAASGVPERAKIYPNPWPAHSADIYGPLPVNAVSNLIDLSRDPRSDKWLWSVAQYSPSSTLTGHASAYSTRPRATASRTSNCGRAGSDSTRLGMAYMTHEDLRQKPHSSVTSRLRIVPAIAQFTYSADFRCKSRPDMDYRRSF